MNEEYTHNEYTETERGQDYGPPAEEPQDYGPPLYGQPPPSYSGYSPPQYGQPPQAPREEENGFGIASFVLGILSVFMFGCCVNYILALLAIIFGIIQIAKYRPKGLAVSGIVLSCLSIIISLFLWIGLLIGIGNMALQEYPTAPDDSFFEEYLDNYLDEL